MWSYDPERLSAHSPIPPMTWRAELSLDYALSTGRTVARHRHQGPLRVLQSLYPEGDAVCHNVLVHPPGGSGGGRCLRRRASGRCDSIAIELIADGALSALAGCLFR